MTDVAKDEAVKVLNAIALEWRGGCPVVVVRTADGTEIEAVILNESAADVHGRLHGVAGGRQFTVSLSSGELVVGDAAPMAVRPCDYGNVLDDGFVQHCLLPEFHAGDHAYDRDQVFAWTANMMAAEKIEDALATYVDVVAGETTTESPLGDEPLPMPLGGEVPSGDLPTIRFAAGRFYSLARRALKHEETTLLKLAKANTDAGYPMEGRAVRHDALAIGSEMLPLFDPQVELPLATDEEVAAAVMNALRAVVHFHAKPASAAIDHEGVLLDKLGKRIAAFAIDLAYSAYAAGRIAREHEPEVLTLRSIPKLGDL